MTELPGLAGCPAYRQRSLGRIAIPSSGGFLPSTLQELEQCIGADFGLIRQQNVTCVPNEYEAGAGNAGGNHSAILVRNQVVLVAVYHESRHLDAWKAAVGAPVQDAQELVQESAIRPVASAPKTEILPLYDPRA